MKIVKGIVTGVGLALWGYFVACITVELLDKVCGVHTVMKNMMEEDLSYGKSEFD